MADVIKFPGAPADRPFADPEAGDTDTETDIDALHSEAFRDLESKISDCTIMAIIAVRMAEPFINTRNDEAERPVSVTGNGSPATQDGSSGNGNRGAGSGPRLKLEHR